MANLAYYNDSPYRNDEYLYVAPIFVRNHDVYYHMLIIY